MKIQRDFFPGDDWVYFQVYTGPNSSDVIIANCAHACAQKLIAQGKVNKWFFVRYYIPDFHLRIRFHVTSRAFVPEVMAEFCNDLDVWIQRKLIWKVSIETYNREIERYGINIDVIETLFYFESDMVSSILSIIHDYADKNDLRWKACLLSLSNLLDDFLFEHESKLKHATFMFNSFLLEFSTAKDLRIQLNEKYRQYKNEIGTLFSSKNDIRLERVKTIISRKSLISKVIIEQLWVLNPETTDNLIGSLMHMLCNRFFISDARLNELVLYSFLVKRYKAEMHIQEKL